MIVVMCVVVVIALAAGVYYVFDRCMFAQYKKIYDSHLVESYLEALRHYGDALNALANLRWKYEELRKQKGLPADPKPYSKTLDF